MKGAFIISDVDLRNGEEHVDGKERGGCNEASFFFFSAFVFAFVEFTVFTACVSKTLGALPSRKHRLFRATLYFLCVPVTQDIG